MLRNDENQAVWTRINTNKLWWKIKAELSCTYRMREPLWQRTNWKWQHDLSVKVQRQKQKRREDPNCCNRWWCKSHISGFGWVPNGQSNPENMANVIKETKKCSSRRYDRPNWRIGNKFWKKEVHSYVQVWLHPSWNSARHLSNMQITASES